MQKSREFSIEMNQKSNQKNENISNYQELYESEREKRYLLEKQLNLQKIKVRNLLMSRGKAGLCPQCLAEFNQTANNQNFVEESKSFSQKIQNLMNKSKYKQVSLLKESTKLTIQNHEPILQNFAIFGIDETDIPKKSEVTRLQNILHSMFPASIIQKQAAQLVFPTGIAVRKLNGRRAIEKAIEIMSYCYTNIKSFLMSFQSQKEDWKYSDNDLLNSLNPQRRLFTICIGIYDYTWCESDPNLLCSLNQIGNKQEDNIKQSKDIQSMKQNSPDENLISAGTIEDQFIQLAITQRVFCIASYYPFFSFFEEILRSLVNIVKMERLAINKHNGENIRQTIKQTDSKYQLERMKNLFTQCMTDFINKKIVFNRSYQLRLINQHKLMLLTDWNYVKTYFVDQWIFTILNMFQLQIFLQLFTLVMLEDRLVFICQNSHVLTYTIYLFVNVLTKPFAYTAPVVTIIPDDEGFLDAPFPVVYGLLRKRKYIDQSKIVERYKNTYVFLTPQSVEIVYTENKKDFIKRKPSKLRNEIERLFKQLKKFRRKQYKPSHYEMDTKDFCIISTQEERDVSVEIVSKVNSYVMEEILKKLPSQKELENLKNKLDQNKIPQNKDCNSYLLGEIISNLRKNSKDLLFDKVLSTQMINSHLFR